MKVEMQYMLKELQRLGELFQTNIDHSPTIVASLISNAGHRSVHFELVPTHEGKQEGKY